MSLEKAKKYLTEQGYADHVIELEESSATVQLAAESPCQSYSYMGYKDNR